MNTKGTPEYTEFPRLPDARDTEAGAFGAVILAAGCSRRAGLFKPGFVYRGMSLLGHAVSGMPSRVKQIVVVSGCRPELVASLVEPFPRAVCVYNPDYERGMFTSVQAGMHHLGDTCRGIFVLPADCPFVGESLYQKMIEAFETGEDNIIPEYRGRGGHPVLIAGKNRVRLCRTDPVSNLRAFLRHSQSRRLAVEDPEILVDIDNPEDIEILRQQEAEKAAGAVFPAKKSFYC